MICNRAKSAIAALVGLAVVIGGAGEGYAVVNPVASGSLSTDMLANVEDLSLGDKAGIVTSGGLTFAESFLGHSIIAAGLFDQVSGTPTSPLSLQANANINDNVNVLSFGGSQVINGLSSSQVQGEGTLAILFPELQFEIGLDILGGTNGSAMLDFFRSDGSLAGSVTVTNLAIAHTPLGFRKADGVADIRGVLIQNTDQGGIGLDNFRYHSQASQQAVPEPLTATLGLMGLGVLGMATRRRSA